MCLVRIQDKITRQLFSDGPSIQHRQKFDWKFREEG